MILAVGSLHGSPGATTLTLALGAAWVEAAGRPALVVEADPDGGVLAARFEDLRADCTVADAVAATRRRFDAQRVLGCARPLWESIPVLVAPPAPEQARAALAVGAAGLAEGLAGIDDCALVDVGRVSSSSPSMPFARSATALLIVVNPVFEAVAALPSRLADLRAAGCDPVVVTVGDQPYRAEQVADATSAEVVAVLPVDVRAAQVFAGGPGSRRTVARSLYWRSVVALAGHLHSDAGHGRDLAAASSWSVDVDRADVEQVR